MIISGVESESPISLINDVDRVTGFCGMSSSSLLPYVVQVDTRIAGLIFPSDTSFEMLASTSQNIPPHNQSSGLYQLPEFGDVSLLNII
mgnify:CR=1 FL=1